MKIYFLPGMLVALAALSVSVQAQKHGPGKVGNAYIKTDCHLKNTHSETLNAKTGKVEPLEDWNADCELRDIHNGKVVASGRIAVEHPAGLVDVAEQIEACIAAESLHDKLAFLVETETKGRNRI